MDADDTLLFDWLHAPPDPARDAEVARRLAAEPALRARLAALTLQEADLAATLAAAPLAAPTPDRPAGARPRTIRHRRAAPVRWWPVTAAATAAAAVAIAALWPRDPRTTPPTPTAVARLVTGTAQADGRALAAGSGLAAGGVLTSDGCELAWDDGSRLHLAPGTRLTLAPPGADAELHAGRVRAEVAPQADGRFALRTPQATAEVVGTVFTLDVGAAGTVLAVAEGRVALVDGATRTEVRAGGSAGSPAFAPPFAMASLALAKGSDPLTALPFADPLAPGRHALRLEWLRRPQDAGWATIDLRLPAPRPATTLALGLRLDRAAQAGLWNAGVIEADGDTWQLAYGPLAELPHDGWRALELPIAKPVKLLHRGGDGAVGGPVRTVLVGLSDGDGATLLVRDLHLSGD